MNKAKTLRVRTLHQSVETLLYRCFGRLSLKLTVGEFNFQNFSRFSSEGNNLCCVQPRYFLSAQVTRVNSRRSPKIWSDRCNYVTDVCKCNNWASFVDRWIVLKRFSFVFCFGLITHNSFWLFWRGSCFDIYLCEYCYNYMYLASLAHSAAYHCVLHYQTSYIIYF